MAGRVIRYVISGCGYFGTAIATVLAKMPDAEITAVFSPGASARRLAKTLETKCFSDYNEMLNGACADAVIIAGPSFTHAEQAIAAARMGKAIFVEKPLALNSVDAYKIIDAVNETKVPFMIGHIMHFYQSVRQIKNMLKEDKNILGRPLALQIERTGWEFARKEVSWKKQEALSGGPLFHHIHEIDLALYFLGRVKTVYAIGGNLVHHGSGFGDENDVLLLLLQHVNGAFSSLQYGSAFWLARHEVRLGFSRGAVLMDFPNNRLIINQEGETTSAVLFEVNENESVENAYRNRGGGSGYGLPGETPPPYLCQALEDELQCWHHFLLNRQLNSEFSDLFDGSSAGESVRVAEAAMRSIGMQAPVFLQG